MSPLQKQLIEAAKAQGYSEKFIRMAMKELEFQEKLFMAIKDCSDHNSCTIGYGDSIDFQNGIIWIDTADGIVTLSPQIVEE